MNQTGFEDFIDYTMANRNAPFKRIKIGGLAENTKKLIKERFGSDIKDINTDNSGIIHAMKKNAHNLEKYDLLNAVGIINAGEDIVLSPKPHKNCDVLIFKKDIEGEITILAEMHKNEGYLLVFDAWRQKKKRLRKDATARKPSANVQDESPHTDTSLSNNPANLSTPNHGRGTH